MAEGGDWELSKENVQPLRHGRKFESLSSALQPSLDLNQTIISQRETFETELRAYSGSDPLDPWYRYIKWTEQNFPKGGKMSNLQKLLQRCASKFAPDERYKNDARFVDVWLQLSQCITDTLELFQLMRDQGVGTKSTRFYEAWAWQLEQLGNTKKADAVYMEGLANNAEPRERLEQQHRQFQSRLGRRLMSGMQDEEFIPPNPVGDQRSALGALRGRGKHSKVGTSRTGNARAEKYDGVGLAEPLSTRNNQSSGVRVFDEEAEATARGPHIGQHSTHHYKKISGREVTDKENSLQPGKWTEHRVPQRNVPPVKIDEPGAMSRPAFTVHEDAVPEDEMRTPVRRAETNSQVLSAKKPDPSFHTLPFIQEEFNPNSTCMYTKHLVYGGVCEMSFEELRAIKENKKMEEKRLEDEKRRIAEEQEKLRIQQQQIEMHAKQLRLREEALLQKAHEEQQRDNQMNLRHMKDTQMKFESGGQPESHQTAQQSGGLSQQERKHQETHLQRPYISDDSDPTVSCTKQLVFNESHSGSFHQNVSIHNTSKGQIPLGNPFQHIAAKSDTSSVKSDTPNTSVTLSSANTSQSKTPNFKMDTSLRSASKNKRQILSKLPAPRTPGSLSEPSPTINTKAALDVIMDALNETLGDYQYGGEPEVTEDHFEANFLKKEPTPSRSFLHSDTESAFSRPTSVIRPTPVRASQPITIFEDPIAEPNKPNDDLGCQPLTIYEDPEEETSKSSHGNSAQSVKVFEDHVAKSTSFQANSSQPVQIFQDSMVKPISFQASTSEAIKIFEDPDIKSDPTASDEKQAFDGFVSQDKVGPYDNDVTGGTGLNKMEDVEMMDENAEIKENIAPSAYKQEVRPRRKLGLLQESADIPVDPESEPEGFKVREIQEPLVEEMEYALPLPDEQTHTNTTKYHNSTAFHTTFVDKSRMASTPCTQGGNLTFTPTSIIHSHNIMAEESFAGVKPSSGNPVLELAQEEVLKDGEKDAKMPVRVLPSENEGMDSTVFSHEVKSLSPIIERSNEDTRSTASSSRSHSGSQGVSLLDKDKPSSLSINVTRRRGRSQTSSCVPVDEEMEEVENLATGLQDLSMQDLDGGNEPEVGHPDPFDDAEQRQILDSLQESYKKFTGYFHNDCDLPDIHDDEQLEIDAFKIVVWIQKKIGEGAFATVYSAVILPMNDMGDDDNGMSVAIKVEKPSNPWEFYITRALHNRMKALDIPQRVRSSLMITDFMFSYNNASCLVTAFHPKGTLLNFVNKFRQGPMRGLHEHVAGVLAINVLELVDAMHQCQIIHGDVKPDNFLLSNVENISDTKQPLSFLKLIDMGRSIDMSQYPEGTTFTAQCSTSGFVCGEMKEGKPWTYQIDYYGVAATIHVILFGSYMKVYKEMGMWKMTSSIPRHLRYNWKGLFNRLLNVPSCDPKDMVDLSGLVAELQEHYPTMRLQNQKIINDISSC